MPAKSGTEARVNGWDWTSGNEFEVVIVETI